MKSLFRTRVHKILGGGDAAEMPFLDHLEELRWRVLWSLLALAVGVGLGIWLVWHFQLLQYLMIPIEPHLTDGKLIFLSITDPFFITLNLGLAVGLVLAAPIIIYQIWSFVAPALTKSERRSIVPSLYLGLVLFSIGVALAYLYALPMTLSFFFSIQMDALQQQITAPFYLSFVVKLLMAFGIAFELPVVILILSAMGLVTGQWLAEKRRYAVAGMAVMSALLTPGDVLAATILLMIPLLGLYELSIVLARIMERRRARALAAEPSAEAV